MHLCKLNCSVFVVAFLMSLFKLHENEKNKVETTIKVPIVVTCHSHLIKFSKSNQIILKSLSFLFQVWFQNRRAKFRKQERLAQQKVANNSSSSDIVHVKSESKSGNTKDTKPSSPSLSNVSTTPNSSASSHQSNGDVKPINGNKL